MGTPRLIAVVTPQHLSLVGGEPELLLGRGLDAHLLGALEEALPGCDLLADAATPAVHAQLNAACGEADGAEERLGLAATHFRRSGFGRADLRALGRHGGAVSVEDCHVALELAARGVSRTTPACAITAGWLAGAASAAFDRPLGSYRAFEVGCAAVSGGSRCVFYVEPLARPRPLRATVGAGQLPPALPPRTALEAAVHEALAVAELVGDDEGRIAAFGAHLVRRSANDHDALHDELERRLPGRAAALLAAASHASALELLRGILASPAWRARVEPFCREPVDRAAALAACGTALGRGRYTALELEPGERLVVRVDAGHEANHALAGRGPGSAARCALTRGVVAAMMELLSGGPPFRAEETRCRAKGDDRCEHVATRG